MFNLFKRKKEEISPYQLATLHELNYKYYLEELSTNRYYEYMQRMEKYDLWYIEMVGQNKVPRQYQLLWYEVEQDNVLNDEDRDMLFKRILARFNHCNRNKLPDEWQLYLKNKEIEYKLKQIEKDFE